MIYSMMLGECLTYHKKRNDLWFAKQCWCLYMDAIFYYLPFFSHVEGEWYIILFLNRSNVGLSLSFFNILEKWNRDIMHPYVLVDSYLLLVGYPSGPNYSSLISIQIWNWNWVPFVEPNGIGLEPPLVMALGITKTKPKA